VLANKTDEILVPQWLGSWVYFQMGYYAFPSTALSSKTKILFMYHQYGFPQKVDRLLDLAHDRGLIVLEDCAHALAGKCGLLDLGFIGGYSLFSFSKYFFCYALGAVRSKDTGFLEYVRQQKVKTKTRVTLFNNAVKAIYEHSADRSSEWLKSIALDLTLMSYALYDTGFRPMNTAERLAKKKIDFELDVRQKYFKHFRERTNNLGICDHLEEDNVFPYMIPIIVADSARDKLVGKLCERGFMTKALRFDMNRLFIEPDFKFCVPIYCHSGIPEDKFEEQIEIVLGVL
jgi:dTDP-4-amino-4,6-dideoxygalactose transaminase